MISAVIENGIVTNIIIGEIEGSIPCPDEIAMGWSYDGETFSPPPAPEPPAPTEDDYREAIQRMLDTAARARRYESGQTLAGYVSSTIPEWAAEAQAYVAWRDAVWVHAYAELDKVMAGQREQPSVNELLNELPSADWPTEA